MDVTITFLTFDLENDPLPGGDGDCKYDWLEVWDGLPGGEQHRAANHRAGKLGRVVSSMRRLTEFKKTATKKPQKNAARSALPTSLSTEVE